MLGINSWSSLTAADIPRCWAISPAPASDEDLTRRPSFSIHLCVVSPHFLWHFCMNLRSFSSGFLKLYALPHSLFLLWIYKEVYFMIWIGELNVVMKIPSAFDMKIALGLIDSGFWKYFNVWGFKVKSVLWFPATLPFEREHIEREESSGAGPIPLLSRWFFKLSLLPYSDPKGTWYVLYEKLKGKGKEYESQVKRGNVSFPICVVLTYHISHLLSADSLSLPLLNTITSW